MRVLAIDPGSYKTGLAMFVNTELTNTSTIEVKITDPKYRRMTMIQRLDDYMMFNRPNIVICEEPYLRGPANNGMQRLLGCIEWLNFGFAPLTFIHPMTVKKKMGAGTLDKLEVALAAGKLLKTDQEKEIMARAIAREAWDETDAVAIGLTFLR